MPEPQRIEPKNTPQRDAKKAVVLLVGTFHEIVGGDQWKGYAYEERHKGDVVHLAPGQADNLIRAGAAVAEADATPDQKAGTAKTPDFPYYSGGPFEPPAPNQVGVSAEDVPTGATAL